MLSTLRPEFVKQTVQNFMSHFQVSEKYLAIHWRYSRTRFIHNWYFKSLILRYPIKKTINLQIGCKRWLVQSLQSWNCSWNSLWRCRYVDKRTQKSCWIIGNFLRMESCSRSWNKFSLFCSATYWDEIYSRCQDWSVHRLVHGFLQLD